MAIITLNVPDPVNQRLLDAISVKFNFSKNALPLETQSGFLQRMLIVTLTQWVKDGERSLLAVTEETNRTNLDRDINTNVVIS